MVWTGIGRCMVWRERVHGLVWRKWFDMWCGGRGLMGKGVDGWCGGRGLMGGVDGASDGYFGGGLMGGLDWDW